MVKFIGDTDWKQSAEIEWTRDNWNVDHAKILYRGRRTGLEDFLEQLTRWSPMNSKFPKMLLEGYQGSNITPSFPGVELNFTGFRGSSLPPRRAVKGNSIQTAQGQGIDTITHQSVSGTFTYIATRTSWYWFETQPPPKDCPFPIVIDAVDPLTRIIRYSIQDDDTGKTNNSVPYSSFVAVFNSLVRGIFVSDYHCEEITSGLLWACSCDVDFKVL